MIKLIIFLIGKTKSNIIFAILLISRFVKNLRYQHIEVVQTIVKYFHSSKNRGITYSSKDKLEIKGYMYLK